MKIGKRYTFQAAHHLPNHNDECRNHHGHGYVLWVEVEGKPQPYSDRPDYGMVIDFSEIDILVGGILKYLDHTDLNVSGKMLGVDYPTAENLCEGIAKQLCSWIAHPRTTSIPRGLSLTNICLSRVRLYETEKAYAEWTA